MITKNSECLDLIALSLIDGLGPVTIKKLVEYYGSTDKIFLMEMRKPGKMPFLSSDVTDKIKRIKGSEEYRDELEYIENEGINVICWNDEDYPESLRNIYDPPPVIYYKGVLPGKQDVCVGIVGARRCSLYGTRIAGALAFGVAEAGLIVVSGMASGIDNAAHRGALKAGERTVAIMGTGFRHLYPEGSEKLVRDICRKGAVMTEFPSGTRPAKSTFPRRNRLISGMSSGVVVVEAARRSGALITADFALEQGKDVFAVPGPVDSLTSSGTNALIQNGAKLVMSEKDILDEILPYGFDEVKNVNRNFFSSEVARPEKQDGGGTVNAVSPDQEKVLEALPSGSRAHIDEIGYRSGISAAKLHAVLLSLELTGKLRSFPGAMYESRAGENYGQR